MQDGLFKIVIATLATWRIACLLYFDDGPFDLFAKAREAIHARSLPSLRVQDGTEQFDRHYIWEFVWSQLSCFWCTTIWVALLAALLVTLPSQLWYGLLPFALSGGAILLSGGGRTIWRSSNES